jgi:hypothetical protein
LKVKNSVIVFLEKLIKVNLTSEDVFRKNFGILSMLGIAVLNSGGTWRRVGISIWVLE